jgi:adenine-specific DNA methylase
LITTPTYGPKNLTQDNWEQKISHLFKRYFPEKEDQEEKRQELLFFVGQQCLGRVTEWMESTSQPKTEETKEMIEKSFMTATDNFMKATATSVDKVIALYNEILLSNDPRGSLSSGKKTSSGKDISWWQERKNYGKA